MNPMIVSRGKPRNKRRQVNERHRVDRVDGMFAMALPASPYAPRLVMDRMESPKESDSMLPNGDPNTRRKSLRKMTSTALKPPRLSRNIVAKLDGNNLIQGQAENTRAPPRNEPVPHEILTQVKAQVQSPTRPQGRPGQALAGKATSRGRKDEEQKRRS